VALLIGSFYYVYKSGPAGGLDYHFASPQRVMMIQGAITHYSINQGRVCSSYPQTKGAEESFYGRMARKFTLIFFLSFGSFM
jgi:hypothetical protein